MLTPAVVFMYGRRMMGNNNLQSCYSSLSRNRNCSTACLSPLFEERERQNESKERKENNKERERKKAVNEE